MIRHPCDAQKSCSLRMISWKEEGFDIYDTCTCGFCKYFRIGIYDFGLVIAWGIITDERFALYATMEVDSVSKSILNSNSEL